MKTPVLLFAYARPQHTRQVLECLRRERIPLLYAYVDGPKTEQQTHVVEEVTALIRNITWCEVRLVCREKNLGLGKSILSGVSEVLGQEEQIIVLEDDLILTAGTYAFFSAALDRYRNEPKVMSITGWTHPRVQPPAAAGRPYFDGRAECWGWATWRRAWQGIEKQDAATLRDKCTRLGIAPDLYGSDLSEMADAEHARNIWAVRFLYWHIVHRGLCLRPSHPMIDHVGLDTAATNFTPNSFHWSVTLPEQVDLPDEWPAPIEESDCASLWKGSFPIPSRTRSKPKKSIVTHLRRSRENLISWLKGGS